MMLWLLLIAQLSYSLCSQSNQNKPPNIIFILSENFGYGDLDWAPFSGKEMEKIETPQLQQLASQGKIFTNFHVASPISSSSRASFLTGLFPWRLGLDFFDGDVNSENENKDQQLPLIVNIANSLQSKGYYTAHIGKWHLGGLYLDEIAVRRSGNCSVAAGVNAYGFDETVVMSEGINHKQFQDQSTQNTYNTGGDYLFRNDQPLEKSPRSTSLTEKETDEAIRFVQERAKDPENKPFYLNLWYNAPNR